MKSIANCKLQIAPSPSPLPQRRGRGEGEGAANCKLSICTGVGLLISLAVPAGVFPAGAKAKATGSNSDLAKLQGSWRVVAGESRGKPKPEDALKDLKWVVKGNKITLKGDEGKNFVLRFHIDATKKPKTINLTNPERKETVQGIYQLDKDRWKLCVGVPGEKRPASFVTREDLNVALFVLEKEKSSQ